MEGERNLRYLEERLRNGIGLIIVGGMDPAGLTATQGHPPFLPAEMDSPFPDPTTEEGASELDELTLPAMRRQAEMAHRYGAACFRQLVHTGSYAIRADFQPGLAASAVPDEMLGETPHALTIGEIRRFVRAYAQAARRCREAGMDGVEVHACHGLLLNSFLSPLTNLRTDDYGGSLENRVRFVREILEAIRAEVGDDFPVGVRMPTDELSPGGADLTELTEIALSLKPLLTYISVSGASEGGRKGGVTVPAVMAGADFPEAVYAKNAGALRSAVGLPVLVTGRIAKPEVAERVLAEGQADLIGMVRALIADPEWVVKVRSGDRENLRVCTGDNEGCRQRTQFRTRGAGLTIGCTVNASVGREDEFDLQPAAEARRVLVIGGGPAGMEAARVARSCGHEVTLCERGDALGGQVRIASCDPRAAGLRESTRYLEVQMQRLEVDVRLNTTITAAMVPEFAADLVIVATGAQPRPPRFNVDSAASVLMARDVLTGRERPGQRVCIVAGFDGHRAPGTLAELLAEDGRDVHLLTERMIVGESQDPGSNHQMQKRLLDKGVTLSPLTGVKSVSGTTVTTFHSLTRREAAIEGIDTVITVERAADDALLRELEASGTAGLVGAGDCLAPRRVLHAVLEGARAGKMAQKL
jgi:2,4-dienoyl-CoA reductase-like NADH-dependent reductase (Old Yellow Enzyme family)/thioredoxin reductase